MNKSIILATVKDEPIAPMGILYVGNALKQAGHNVVIYDLKPEEIEEAAKSIAELKPLFLGISTLTGLQTRHSAVLSMSVKQINSKIPIVWGGIHPSILPDECLKEDYIDAVVIGEGEETIIEVAQAYFNGGGLEGILGTGYSKNGETILNKPRPMQRDIDKFRMDWTLVDINRYIRRTHKGNSQIDFVTSRGCPFNCGFCYNAAFNKRRWRAHSIDHVLESIDRLKKTADIDAIQMQDDNFFVNDARAIEIISKLKKRDVQSDYIQMRIEKVQEEIIKALIENGIERLFIGWESANPRILKLINKNITREQLIDKFLLLSKFPKLSANASAIVGFPTETWKEIYVTIDFSLFISKLIPGVLINLFTYLPYPGSSIYELAIKEGFNPPACQFDWGVFDLLDSRDLDISWLPWIKEKEKKIFYRLDKYAQLLNHAKSTSLIRTRVKKIFYHSARFRFKHRFFKYPLEIKIQERFANTTKYGIPLSQNKGKFFRETDRQRCKSGKIKICHVIESLGPGGAERRLVSDLEKIDNNKFDNIVCFLYRDNHFEKDILRKNIPVYCLGMKSIYDWPRCIFKLANIIRKHKVDIIHTQLFGANIYGRVIGKLMGVKAIISTIQSPDYERDEYLYSNKRRILDKITGKLCNQKFIAVSDYVKQSVMKNLGFREENIHIIYNSVNFDNFKVSSPKEIEEFRKQLNLNNNNIILVNIGRLDPPKGHRNLILGFKKIVSKLPEAKLLIIGKGPLEEELKDLANTLGLQNHILFLGIRNDINKILQICDIFVSTSLREGLSLSILEALSMKKPCVVSKKVYMQEILKDGETAFIVDPDDIDGIAKKIIDVINSSQEAKEIAERGHALVKEKFDAVKNVKLLERVYTEALSNFK